MRAVAGLHRASQSCNQLLGRCRELSRGLQLQILLQRLLCLRRRHHLAVLDSRLGKQVHTLLVVKLDLPPFIDTVGTLAGLRSLAKVLSNDAKIPVNNDAFRALYTVWWVPILILVLVAVGTAVLMGRTQVGRHLYALGGNEEGARLSGLRVGQLKLIAYSMAALLSAIVGILYAARQGQGDAESTVGYELNAIAAAVVGGCRLRGGIGTIGGTVLGVTFLTIVVNGIANVIKVDSTQWEGLVTGVVLILAMGINRLRKEKD